MDETITSERAQERGRARGQELFEAIMNDNYDRQAVLMERKQRELKICKETFSDEVATKYHQGFVEGLIHSAALLLPKEEVQAAEDKVRKWSSELAGRGAVARGAGSALAWSLFKAAVHYDRLTLDSWLTEYDKARQEHRGVQWREFQAAYVSRLQILMEEHCKSVGLSMADLLEFLKDKKIPLPS